MREGKELHLFAEEGIELLQRQRAVFLHRHKAQTRAAAYRQQLPWHQVAMVLHLGEQNDIALVDELPAPRLRHEIDALSGSAREDDLFGTRRANIIRHPLACAFVSVR